MHRKTQTLNQEPNFLSSQKFLQTLNFTKNENQINNETGIILNTAFNNLTLKKKGKKKRLNHSVGEEDTKVNNKNMTKIQTLNINDNHTNIYINTAD